MKPLTTEACIIGKGMFVDTFPSNFVEVGGIDFFKLLFRLMDVRLSLVPGDARGGAHASLCSLAICKNGKTKVLNFYEEGCRLRMR